MIKAHRPAVRPRLHSGPGNAMFDDVHELFNDDDAAQLDQLPPPFAAAGTAAIATAAVTLAMANTNASNTAPSEHNVPAYQPPLRQRISGFHSRHTELTAKLQALGDIPAMLETNQHDIFSVTGKVKTQEARLKTLQAVSQETRDTHAKMSSSFAKRMMNKRGNRSRLLFQAGTDAEKAAQQQADHEAELERNRSILALKEQRKSQLQRDLVEYSAVSNELDKIDHALFDGSTPEFVQDDLAEWEVKVWTQVQVFMAAETLREKRARQMLKDASPILVSIIKDIQTALQFCIDSGVARNQKYTKNLISNTTAKSTVSGTQPLVLKAKTSSGKFFTTIAKARGSQLLVERPPEFRLIELYLMPGSKNPKAVDERGLHKSLETSYAQAKALDAYLKREIAASLERQRKLAVETAKLQETVKDARRHLREIRRSIMVAVVQEDGSQYIRKEAPTSTADHDSSPSGAAQRDYALPLQDAANPMISTHFQENLRKESHARLRQLVALPEPESDDDNLYPVIA
ncbi:hypothetical protein PSEUBRA_000742 [Kalmanozyma brasiliensis GHG001]|uniref:Uncharacterized protein n=1 Tax=Kalmanozyma brasiliensis (strain GHG001) TaxID=1365824 RepID=V5GUH6_KALBG|nr:uncharacterized protein PSEUBRA_000742 [Kalmanozyma brasiliensis GHG001]EST09527.1 hypothetical protein PSEUBRA_000742 [Kalmanozyma brasiliensis GHG001]